MLRNRADIPVLWYRWLALVIGTVGYLATDGGAPLNMAVLAALGGAILYTLVLSIAGLVRRRHPWPWYITAVLDVVSASLLVVLTDGVGSPFLPYYLTPVLVVSLWGSLQWAVGGTVGLGLLYPLLVALSTWGRWDEFLSDAALLARFLVSEGLIFLLALLVVLLVGPLLRWRERESELALYERLFALAGAGRPGVLAVITDEVLRTLPADVALIFLHDPIRKRLELQVPDPYPMTTLSRATLQRIEWDQEFLNRLLAAGSPALLLGEDARFPIPEAIRSIFLSQPFLVAPLVLEEETIGLMLAGRRRTQEPLRDQDLHTMSELASRAARVLGWTESLYNLQRRYAEMSALNRVLQAINSPRRLEEVLQRIVESAREVLSVDRASVMLLDDSGERLCVRAVAGTPFARPLSEGVPVGQGISGQVAQLGQPLLLKPGEAARFRPEADREVKEALCLPLRTEEQTIGVLNLSLLSGSGRTITQEDVRLAQLLADAAAVAIAKADLVEKLFARTQELSRANRELAAERHRLAQVIGGIPDGVVVLDDADRIVLWNRAALRLFGLSEEKIHGANVGAYFQEQGLEEPYHLLQWLHSIPQAPSEALTYRGPLRRDDNRIYEVWINPILTEAEGEVKYEGTVATIRDITAGVEEERARAEFISTMAQDIRTPLTAIQGYLELLADGEAGPVTPKQGEFLARSKDNLERCVQMLNDFLDLSRIRAGGLTLYFEPVHVGQIVREAVEAFQPRAASKQIELRMSVPPDLPPIVASQTGLRQVLNNLLDNAIKYTSSQGQVLVRLEDEGTHLKCYVQDTGIGVPPETQSKAFERYGEGGRRVGLGLYIAKQIVEAHGGAIGLTSEPGRGTVAFFTLPKDYARDAQRKNQGA